MHVNARLSIEKDVLGIIKIFSVMTTNNHRQGSCIKWKVTKVLNLTTTTWLHSLLSASYSADKPTIATSPVNTLKSVLQQRWLLKARFCKRYNHPQLTTMFYSHTQLDTCSISLVHISNCFSKSKNLNCEMADFSGFHREIIKMMLNLYIISRVTLDIQKLMKNHDGSVPSPF